MNVPPASTNRSSMRCEVCSSASRPKVIAPRHSSLTFRPVLPRKRYSITPPYAFECARRQGSARGDPGVAAFTGTDEVRDDSGQRGGEQTDERQVFTVLAGGLPRRVLGVRGEPFPPADQPEGTVGGETRL